MHGFQEEEFYKKSGVHGLFTSKLTAVLVCHILLSTTSQRIVALSSLSLILSHIPQY
jgi:hypothetical protein